MTKLAVHSVCQLARTTTMEKVQVGGRYLTVEEVVNVAVHGCPVVVDETALEKVGATHASPSESRAQQLGSTRQDDERGTRTL